MKLLDGLTNLNDTLAVDAASPTPSNTNESSAGKDLELIRQESQIKECFTAEFLKKNDLPELEIKLRPLEETYANMTLRKLLNKKL